VVNQRFTFAIHILAMLARSDRFLGSRAVAESANTNPVVIRRLLLALRRARLIETCSGKHGGAKLAKPPNRISLLDIYNAVEPRPAIAVSSRKIFRKCPVSCSIKAVMSEVSGGADRAMRNHLRSVSLAQVLRKIR
jgi:Rrf2 family protein